jgi:hypothetical protein
MLEVFRHTVPELISLASESYLLSHKPLFFAFCTQYILFLISHDGVFGGNSHHLRLPNQVRSHPAGLSQHERTVRYWPSYRRSLSGGTLLRPKRDGG